MSHPPFHIAFKDRKIMHPAIEQPREFPTLQRWVSFAWMLLLTLVAAAQGTDSIPVAPPTAEQSLPKVFGQAFHILPQTHNHESGYFSLCEGLDGKLYVGAAKYGVDSYLVELDPNNGEQRVVIDTHRLCSYAGTGFAAQSKIHT